MATESDKEQSPLIAAVLKNDMEAVKSLVENGADLNAKDGRGRTALMWACRRKNEAVVKYLVEHRADVNAKDDRGETALMSACWRGNGDIVKCLVDHGADVNAKDNYGKTALMLASDRENNEDIFKYLVEHGADLEAKDSYGQTALIRAIGKENNEDVVEYLVEKGANVNAQNEDGQTALILALGKENNVDVVESLVEYGADVKAKDLYGRTVLMLAVEKNNEGAVESLVKKGADVNAKNSKGQTVLMLAGMKNNEDIFKYLVAHGADLEVKDNEGMGIAKYYPESLDREYVEQQRKEYAGDAWKDILEHMTASTYDNAGCAGYTTENGLISIGVDIVPDESSELLGRKSPDGKGVEEDVYPIRSGFVQMMTLVHEGNHRLHIILDGDRDGNFTAEQNVKVNYCTEAVAHTSECLAAALQYQRMKEAGIKTYQYQDLEGNVQNIPLEEVLNRYPPELREYVTKNGFDPNNKKDVEAVTEIGLQYWEKRQELYSGLLGQFFQSAVPQGTGKGISQKEFDALINRMCEGVVIGDGVELDLRQFADRFNGMTDEEAQKHIARRNGNAAQKTEKSVENSNKEVLKKELREQTGNGVELDSASKIKELCLARRLKKRALEQETVERQGAVESTKKTKKTEEQQLVLPIVNAANRGRV